MTDIEKVEKLLREYKVLKVEIDAIKINIKSIGQKGMNYTGMPGSKNIKDTVSHDFMELENLKHEKFDKEIKIEQIENMLKLLNEEEYKIINLRYFKELEIFKVASSLNVSAHTVYNKRLKMFNKKLIPYAKRHNLI